MKAMYHVHTAKRSIGMLSRKSIQQANNVFGDNIEIRLEEVCVAAASSNGCPTCSPSREPGILSR
jgi:hypothetical protein